MMTIRLLMMTMKTLTLKRRTIVRLSLMWRASSKKTEIVWIFHESSMCCDALRKEIKIETGKGLELKLDYQIKQNFESQAIDPWDIGHSDLPMVAEQDPGKDQQVLEACENGAQALCQQDATILRSCWRNLSFLLCTAPMGQLTLRPFMSWFWRSSNKEGKAHCRFDVIPGLFKSSRSALRGV